MQLTQFTDFSLRVLLYQCLKMRRSTVKEISRNFNISQNHLLKVVHNLGKLGLVKNFKGRGGGIEIHPAALEMTISEVVQKTESNMNLVECFDKHENTCPIIGACKLEKLLYRARKAFLLELSRVKIKDLGSMGGHDSRLKILGIEKR